MDDRSKEQQQERRTRRLSLALRDNLKRRKAQARGRNMAGRPSDGHDSAEPGNNKQKD